MRLKKVLTSNLTVAYINIDAITNITETEERDRDGLVFWRVWLSDGGTLRITNTSLQEILNDLAIGD